MLSVYEFICVVAVICYLLVARYLMFMLASKKRLFPEPWLTMFFAAISTIVFLPIHIITKEVLVIASTSFEFFVYGFCIISMGIISMQAAAKAERKLNGL